jgi:hypothetical protein
MSPIEAAAERRSGAQAPALRLLPSLSPCHPGGPHAPESLRGPDTEPPQLHVIAGPTRILLAGADAGRRETLLDELSHTLPESTVFEQADAVCDALEHASASRMAFITGDLDDAPAESLMQTLAHRHPELPVLILDSVDGEHDRRGAYREELCLRHG